MKKRHTVDPDELERLKKAVEHYVDFPIKTPDDFARLSETLQAKGCGYVSATTLKRIWGYISDTGEDYCPSEFTLSTICKMIGFKNMEEFSDSNFPIQSREYTGKFIESHKIPEGALVELRWAPNRICVLRHLKPTIFKVEQIEGSKNLSIGDLVECVCFTQHAPVFLRIFRDGKIPSTYVAGSANGVSFKVIVD